MSFQILNKDGEAIAINLLDAEAATFWKKELHPGNYANPAVITDDMTEFQKVIAETSGNWFDIIGYCIHSQGHNCSGWPNIVATMIVDSLGMKFIDTSEGYKDRPIKLPEWQKHEYKNKEGEDKITYHLPDKLEESIFGLYSFYQPYIDLINHWQSKGYQPKQIKE